MSRYRRYPIRFLCVGLLAAGSWAWASEGDLSVADAAREAAAGRMLLVDIRTPQEWRETGYPKGAQRVDWHQGETSFRERMLALVKGDRNVPVALICRTGNRSAQALASLRAAGFSKVYHVPAGMATGAGWLRAGLPVSQCAAEC